MTATQELLAGLTPPGAVACASADTGSPEHGGPGLLPEEVGLVGPEISPRRFQSIGARECARAALVRLGVRPVGIPRSTSGAPVWPDGIVGSLTHTAGLQAAVVGPRSAFAGLGIDVEPCYRLRPGVARTFAAPSELAAATGTLGEPGPLAVFCAKEAAFKAWFPATGVWLAMTDVAVAFTPDGTFAVRARQEDGTVDRGGVLVDGRVGVRAGFVVAVAWCARRAVPTSTLGTVFPVVRPLTSGRHSRDAEDPAPAP